MSLNYFSIALKNLTRHKSKSITTILAVVIVVAAYILVDSMLVGVNIESKRNIVNYEIGSSKIYKKEYYDIKDERPMYESFTNWKPIVDLLDKNGFNSAPRFTFGGSLIGEEVELPFLFYGVYPDMERETFGYSDYILEGGKFIDDSGEFDIVLGVNGANDLGAKVGDLITLSTIIDEYDEERGGKISHRNEILTLTVVGLLESPNPLINGNVGYIPMNILKDENGLYIEDYVTDICIRKKGADKHALPKKSESAVVVADILKKQYSDLREYDREIEDGKKVTTEKIGYLFDNDLLLVDWSEDASDFIKVANADRSATGIFILLLLFLSFIGINNTMLLAVMDRTKEIGMIRSLGMTDGQVIRLFLTEAFLFGFIGAIVGTIIGVVLNIFMVQYGIDMTSMMQDIDGTYGYRFKGVMKSAWSIKAIVIASIIAMVSAVVSSIAPSRMAVKKSITDALRFE